MSTLVVNSLKNSTGSSPTLVWPVSDGTDGQVLSSTNNSGTLAFTGAQLEAQNGTNITFPASAPDNAFFTTNASGALSATVAGANPMNTPDNVHQGERLLDRYVISGGGTPVNDIVLNTPTGYTTTDLNTIRTLKVVYRGLGASAGYWQPYIALTIGYNNTNTFYFSGGDQFSITKMHWTPSPSYANDNCVVTTSVQKIIGTRNSVYRNNSDGAVDYFTNTTTDAVKQANGSNSLLFGEQIIDCSTYPTIENDLKYSAGNGQGYQHNDVTYFALQGTTLRNGNTKGRHPMGVEISNSTGSAFSCGVVELYGVFKDGVVS